MVKSYGSPLFDVQIFMLKLAMFVEAWDAVVGDGCIGAGALCGLYRSWWNVDMKFHLKSSGEVCRTWMVNPVQLTHMIHFLFPWFFSDPRGSQWVNRSRSSFGRPCLCLPMLLILSSTRASWIPSHVQRSFLCEKNTLNNSGLLPGVLPIMGIQHLLTSKYKYERTG